MKRTISGDMAVPAGGGETSGGALPEAARRPLRELMDDRLLDALLERSRDQAGGLRLTGEGSMPVPLGSSLNSADANFPACCTSASAQSSSASV
jgi:hypothetical protein